MKTEVIRRLKTRFLGKQRAIFQIDLAKSRDFSFTPEKPKKVHRLKKKRKFSSKMNMKMKMRMQVKLMKINTMARNTQRQMLPSRVWPNLVNWQTIRRMEEIFSLYKSDPLDLRRATSLLLLWMANWWRLRKTRTTIIEACTSWWSTPKPARSFWQKHLTPTQHQMHLKTSSHTIFQMTTSLLLPVRMTVLTDCLTMFKHSLAKWDLRRSGNSNTERALYLLVKLVNLRLILVRKEAKIRIWYRLCKYLRLVMLEFLRRYTIIKRNFSKINGRNKFRPTKKPKRSSVKGWAPKPQKQWQKTVPRATVKMRKLRTRDWTQDQCRPWRKQTSKQKQD